MIRIALITVVLGSSVAYADEVDPDGRDPIGEPSGYVAAGVMTGKDRYELHGFVAEAGKRIERSMFFGRVQASAGTTGLRSGRGTFHEERAGVEARKCNLTGIVCASLGLDLGMHRSSFKLYVDPATRAKPEMLPTQQQRLDTTVLVPRFTIDGGQRVRVRGVIELPRHLNDEESLSGISISLSLGVGF